MQKILKLYVYKKKNEKMDSNHEQLEKMLNDGWVIKGTFEANEKLKIDPEKVSDFEIALEYVLLERQNKKNLKNKYKVVLSDIFIFDSGKNSHEEVNEILKKGEWIYDSMIRLNQVFQTNDVEKLKSSNLIILKKNEFKIEVT